MSPLPHHCVLSYGIGFVILLFTLQILLIHFLFTERSRKIIHVETYSIDISIILIHHDNDFRIQHIPDNVVIKKGRNEGDAYTLVQSAYV